MESFGFVAFEGEVGGEAIGHFAVGFGGGEGLVDDEGCGLFAVAKLHVAEGDGGVDDAEGGASLVTVSSVSMARARSPWRIC